MRFPSLDALRVALLTGLVPTTAQERPVRWAEAEGGALLVEPIERLGDVERRALREVGVEGARMEGAAWTVPCWAAVLPVVRDPYGLGAVDVALFEVGTRAALLSLATELVRLGCDRLRWAAAAHDESAFLCADAPPFYSVLRAVDGAGLGRVLVPRGGPDDDVWIDAGHRHPLIDRLRAPAGTWLLVGREAWRSVEPHRFVDALASFALTVTAPSVTLEPVALEAPLRVELRLAPALRGCAPTLWIVRHRAIAQLDAFVESASEDVVDALLFALAGPRDQPIVILRARPGREIAELPLDAEAHASIAFVPDTFAPVGTAIEPPLRPQRLARALLGTSATSDHVHWLAPLGGGRFRVESLAERALVPLADWTEHHAHAAAEALEPWVRAVTFDLEPFTTDTSEADTSETVEEREAPTRGGRRALRARRSASAIDLAASPGPGSTSGTQSNAFVEAARAPVSDRDPNAATEADPTEHELAALEMRLRDMDEPADDLARTAIWSRMAELHEVAQNGDEAALCLVRAAWLARGEAHADAIAAWAGLEARLRDVPTVLQTVASVQGGGPGLWLRNDTRPRALRALAAVLALAGHHPALGQRLREAKVLPDLAKRVREHDGRLDVRAAWLAHVGIAMLAGGDPLGLARARDRLLARIRNGLSLERDVPAFLRFAPRIANGRDGARATRFAATLVGLLESLERTARRRSAVEAPEEQTRAYVRLEVAFGLARLGAHERAHQLRGDALSALDVLDPVHGFLARAYGARIDQALDGVPAATPLPASLVAEHASLETFARYKVDRLRELSFVLEPHAKPDPIAAFASGARDPRDELRELVEAADGARALERTLDLWIESARTPDDRARALAGLVGVLPALPERVAIGRLEHLVSLAREIAPVARASILDAAIAAALHFDRHEIAHTFADELREALASLPTDRAVRLVSAIGPGMSALRRSGHEAVAIALLAGLAARATGDDVASLVARAEIGADIARMGSPERVDPLVAPARARLGDASLLVPDRLRLTRALAAAATHLSQDLAVEAVGRLALQWPHVTDSYNTNSHFCLSAIALVDALVIALASEDETPDARARRALEADAELVRRRIREDLDR